MSPEGRSMDSTAPAEEEFPQNVSAKMSDPQQEL